MPTGAVLRASRHTFVDEVVEDSEPEREALRQIQKLEKKRRKLAAMNEGPTVAPTRLSPSPSRVILISDESVPASPLITRQLATKVIDISDTSTNISVNQNVISLDSNTTSANPETAAADASPHTDVAAPPATLSESQHSDDEEIFPTLNLARFAFNKPRPLQHRNSASTVGSTSNSDSQAKPPAKKTARSSSKRLEGEFSDTELKKLAKCVGCDIAWTTRKSAVQKMAHIRSCAKKTGLTDVTVRALIRKEIDSAPSDPGPSNRKRKTLEDVPTTHTTLLEDVVRDAAPKRKGKRKAVVDTLKSVSETRENIRDRAQMVFGAGPSPDGDSFIVQTQAIRADTFGTTQGPYATQAFGPSRLGQQWGSKPSLFGDQDSEGEPDLPPATQGFAPSKLGARKTTGGWGYESESEESSVPEPTKNPLDLSVFSSAKEVSPRSSPKTKKRIAPAAAPPLVESDGWNDDDSAYVHFDPELNTEMVNISPTHSPKPTTKKKKMIPEASPKTKRKIRIPADADESPRPSSPKKKRSRKKNEDEFDENWELGLKKKILEDRDDLQLRILRYEPINFDVFLRLATEDEEDKASARLRLKLRAFLDKQAINFYGGEAGKTGSRTRKR
ncbi:hypothetical protein C8F04DRAFT_1249772 [Mycena alexandri]|uniref:Uncharacterized protein n=1 Tax=Mycena alexandri TaxID=1745969 RepID=A0AAD6TIH1_9AGAR|nr:hypothetical protein C8F04DRAFT_1249772 [Mycena alexandri]